MVHSVLFLALSACTASPLQQTPGNPLPGPGSATLTPFLPASETPTSTVTETPTSTPSPSPTPSPTPSLRVDLAAVGDINLARSIGERVQAEGPQIVFAGVQTSFDAADVLVGNLECAITTVSERQPKSYTFAAPLETAESLALAGFDVIGLANNHAMDYGYAGLEETRATLEGYGIASAGAGANETEAHSPVIVERNGLRLAFLSFVDVPDESAGFSTRTWIATDTQPGIAWANVTQIAADVAAAKTQADVVIVLLHSGYEANDYLPIVSSNLRAEAQTAIDAGASLVIGSHPHALLPIVEYNGGLIAYSLGNFVFDGFTGLTNATIVLHVTLTPSGVEDYSWTPVMIENGLPRPATDTEIPAIESLLAP